MFTPRSNHSSKPSKASSSLDRKQQALREKELQLQKKKEQLNQLINEAPQRREEYAERRRRRLASDSSLAPKPLGDKRYEATIAGEMPMGRRMLRTEKRDGKLVFLVLCAVLVMVLIWVTRLVMSHLG
ncbi:MAG TPA: hypothetical protein VNQ90_11500 [Chthoniobacteraceae bacterium]|nr:hypothetical protein [Chthoniobacteraceae bacterium]